jgi:hypothetical protein
MPASPPLSTFTHKSPPKGVYGAEEKLVKPALVLYELKNSIKGTNIRPV